MTIGIQVLRDIDRFFAQKQYDRAISLLERTVKENPSESSLKLKLADAYYLYGKNEKSVDLLTEVAEEFARKGFITKAMAVQKKINRIDPLADIDIYRFIEDMEEPEPETPEVPPKMGKPAETHTPEAATEDASFRVLDNLFKGLNKSEFADVLKVLDEKTMFRDEIVFKEGDTDNSVYIIILGSVRVLIEHNGKSVQLALLKEGDFFGEVALLTGRARTATVQCFEDSVFLVLEREKFLGLSKQYPGLKENLTVALEHRAQSAIETLLEIDSKE